MEIDNTAIGLKIRIEREKLRLSREEFAELIGLSEYYIGQLERGERQMSLPTMVKVARHLHISLDYLILGATEPHQYYVYEKANTYETGSYAQDPEIIDLLNKCSAQEFMLIKKLVQTILPYIVKE